MYDNDFTVSIREWQNPDNLESKYYAVIFDSHGRLRSKGSLHLEKSDSLKDAMCFLENIPTRVY
jgi:hypothetical protein|tara:strand:+ start:840 stop:1031 length:192 start_codon:yes stop_codon:yes gene_type:complete